MELAGITNQALLDAEVELWHNTFAYIKSMALKSALDLGLADAIHQHGGSATLPQIVSRVTLHPSKTLHLRRLMRVLATTGVFSVEHPSDGSSSSSSSCEPVYKLTPMSALLVGSGCRSSLVPFIALMVHPALVTPFFELGKWLQCELPGPCIFEQRHGETVWQHANGNTAFNALVNDGMLADSHFIMDIAIKECPHVFQGISSLVDIGGGLGAAAQAISMTFPGVKCSVLDLDHVVGKAPTDTQVCYVGGDMFDYVPPANAMFLKWVLHDWGHEECVKIMKNCRKAIPARQEGGKVIIIDIVVGAGPSESRQKEMQALFDLYMMVINGMERDEQEWKKIFLEAGFSDYKITPVLGVRSIIEVYP